MPRPELTIVSRYDLLGPVAAFETAIAALADRVAREGDPGVRTYRFYVNADTREARAVIDYDTPDAWLGHHETAMAWPEMAALHRAARLAEVTFLGPVTPEIRAWLAASSLTARLETGSRFVAGFQREA